MFYRGKLQSKHSFKVSELLRHYLKLDELKVYWTVWYVLH